MPGLDPGIHNARQRMEASGSPTSWSVTMDCRVKPGNDLDRIATH
jgi:hypothetical protein